ncbi:hypothetical protein ACVXG7_07520 [Enterobacter hormaechei]
MEKPYYFRQRPENARSSRDQAQATLKSAQDKLSQYRTGNRAQDIAQAKASLEQAQAQLPRRSWICTTPR